MRLQAFINSRYEAMEKELSYVTSSLHDVVQQSKKSAAIILKNLTSLKSYIDEYNFKSSNEEIAFFKNFKPRFLSSLLYFQYIGRIELYKPIGPSTVIRLYYEHEMKSINNYFNRNSEFYLYYKSGSDYLDEYYFIRKETDSWLLLDFEDYQTDPKFTTIYDYRLSKFIAFQQLSVYIQQQLKNLDSSINNSQRTTVEKNDIRWTGSKVSLVELLYALQSTGSCNNGNIDLKHLAKHIEKVFNIDLGNYYRIFQEMRIRKINRTSFMDELKEKLIHRMDETDENPRFK